MPGLSLLLVLTLILLRLPLRLTSLPHTAITSDNDSVYHSNFCDSIHSAIISHILGKLHYGIGCFYRYQLHCWHCRDFHMVDSADLVTPGPGVLVTPDLVCLGAA